jgi:hypothetical protein
LQKNADICFIYHNKKLWKHCRRQWFRAGRKKVEVMQIQEVNKSNLQETKAAEAMEAAITKESSKNEAPVKASETQQMSDSDKLKAYKSATQAASMQVSGNGDTASFSQTGLAMSHASEKERVVTTTTLDGEKKELPKLNKLNVPIPD